MECLSVWRSAETLSSPLLNFVYRSRESGIKITALFKNNNNNKKKKNHRGEKLSILMLQLEVYYFEVVAIL